MVYPPQLTAGFGGATGRKLASNAGGKQCRQKQEESKLNSYYT